MRTENNTIKKEPINLDGLVSSTPPSSTRGYSDTRLREEATNGVKRQYRDSHAAESEKLKKVDDGLKMEVEYLERLVEAGRARREK